MMVGDVIIEGNSARSLHVAETFSQEYECSNRGCE